MQIGVNAPLVFAAYAVVMIGIGFYVMHRHGSSLQEFVLAKREANWVMSAFSIAATWIWAPALFVSTQQAYIHGVVGWGWFFLPNIACLAIFGVLAWKVRENFEGMTLPEFMGKKYSGRVQVMYDVQFIILQLFSFSVQILAGAGVLSLLTGLPFAAVAAIIAGVVVIYSILGGLRASLITDFLQMIFILVVGAVGLFVVLRGAGVSSIEAGLGGISGDYRRLFSPQGAAVTMSFGIITAIGLFAGPFGDQTFWQRVFAMPKKNVSKSFAFAALIFGIVPLIFGLIGFAGAGAGIQMEGAQHANLRIISEFASPALMTMIVVLLVAGLSSTMDSNLIAMSSIAVADIWPAIREKVGVNLSDMGVARATVAGTAMLASLIALIPGLQIVHLFMFYGTLRATTLMPTVITIMRGKCRESSIFYGLVGSIGVAVPIYAVSALMGAWQGQLIGALLAVFISGGISLIGSRSA